MVKRLAEQYRPGDAVEVMFERDGDALWQRGQVVAHQPPGVWVRTADGQMWFVTNTRRIRPATDPTTPPTGHSEAT
jgi:hypothetical protein